MIAAALSMALMFGWWPHKAPDPKAPAKAHQPKPPPSHGRAGDWRYEVNTDRFTGEKSCVLKGRDHRSKVAMIYFNGVVGFRFDHLDVHDAAYRVDNGEPRASLNQAQGNLGWVFAPADSLAHAHHVLIRPAPKLAPKDVFLAGLDDALTRTTALGCAPEAFPQPDFND